MSGDKSKKFVKQCLCGVLQYQMDTDQLSETLTKLNNSLDPKTVSKKSNSETLLQLEVELA